MNFPYSMLLVLPWKCILILSMNLYPGFPRYQPLFLEQHPSARAPASQEKSQHYSHGSTGAT